MEHVKFKLSKLWIKNLLMMINIIIFIIVLIILVTTHLFLYSKQSYTTHANKTSKIPCLLRNLL